MGTWESLSLTNIKTRDVKLPKNDNKIIAEFKSDSLYFYIDSLHYGSEFYNNIPKSMKSKEAEEKFGI